MTDFAAGFVRAGGAPSCSPFGGHARAARVRESVDALNYAFRFEPGATSFSTSLQEVLRLRRGGCQDFAHLLISCLRQLGLPADYVSGYQLTEPPPGSPRLLGADASHAWVSVHVPEFGWIDYDPTNRCLAGGDHIVVARGRDYSDVSPVKGVFRGGGEHLLRTGVTVEPLS